MEIKRRAGDENGHQYGAPMETKRKGNRIIAAMALSSQRHARLLCAYGGEQINQLLGRQAVASNK